MPTFAKIPKPGPIPAEIFPGSGESLLLGSKKPKPYPKPRQAVPPQQNYLPIHNHPALTNPKPTIKAPHPSPPINPPPAVNNPLKFPGPHPTPTLDHHISSQAGPNQIQRIHKAKGHAAGKSSGKIVQRHERVKLSLRVHLDCKIFWEQNCANFLERGFGLGFKGSGGMWRIRQINAGIWRI